MQDKFRLDLSDEEAVHYMQSLIDESVHALFAAVVEQIHKFAQVSYIQTNASLLDQLRKYSLKDDCRKVMSVLCLPAISYGLLNLLEEGDKICQNEKDILAGL